MSTLHEKQPVYRQLADKLREYVQMNSNEPGKRLPSEPALAKKFGVARMTLRKALDLLEGEGLIERQQGRGNFIAYAPSADHPAFFGASHDKTALTVETIDHWPHMFKFWEDAKNLFEARHRGLTFNIAHPWTRDTMLASEETPDVIVTSIANISRLLDRDVIGAHKQYFDPTEFHPEFSQIASFGFPFAMFFDVLVVNLDIVRKKKIRFFDRLPSLGEFFATVHDWHGRMPKLKLLETYNSFPHRTTGGSDLFTAEGRLRLPDEIRPALEALLEIEDAFCLRYPRRIDWFLAGKSLMCHCSIGSFPLLREHCSFATRIFPLPMTAPDRHQLLATAAMVGNRSRSPELAALLVAFLASEEAQRLFVRHGYGAPARRTVQPEYFSTGWQGIGECRETLDHGRAIGIDLPFFSSYAESILGPECAAVLNGSITVDRGVENIRQRTRLMHAAVERENEARRTRAVGHF